MMLAGAARFLDQALDADPGDPSSCFIERTNRVVHSGPNEGVAKVPNIHRVLGRRPHYQRKCASICAFSGRNSMSKSGFSPAMRYIPSNKPRRTM